MVTGLLLGLLGAIAIVTLAALIRFEYVIQRSLYRPSGKQDELPTVSVCIPARNEKHAMTECLERVLASEYPKLEIIVLDDSSVDDTSMLIKSFAHAGVRFVEGHALPDGWLGKNNALQGLLEEASGTYILYLDVDTTLKPQSISALVSWALSRKLDLASVIPQREDGLRASVFLGTLRYFWVLSLGNRKNPAVSGASWLVDRQKLQELGGFTAFMEHTQPDMAVAQALGVNDGRQLVVSNSHLGISYEKKWTSQVETSVRLLAPLFGNAFSAMSVALLLIGIVMIPIASLVVFILQAYSLGLYAALIVLAIITTLSLRYFKIAWRHGWWLGAIHWPYIVLQEAALVCISVIMYARDAVTWKGRPIKNTIVK
jgi:glycosyltransferase involved in cell wall biosynthesis